MKKVLSTKHCLTESFRWITFLLSVFMCAIFSAFTDKRDMEKEHKKALSKAARDLSAMTTRALKAETSRDQWHEKWKQQQSTLYAALTDILKIHPFRLPCCGRKGRKYRTVV